MLHYPKGMTTSDSRQPADRVLQYADLLDGRFALWAGPLAPRVDDGLARLTRDEVIAGLYAKQPALWSSDPAVQAKIANRLGWLTSPEWVIPSLPRVQQFADGIRASGVTHVVLLGMGGSSLAPEVLRAVLGVKPGWPSFHMLDSTDPGSVAAIDAAIDLPRTLFVLASKSGGTIEPNSMAAHFKARLESSGFAAWAEQFVAITDEGTALHRRALEERFRDVFVNPSDIGGRYSALSFFGLVPAALMGHDPAILVDWARAMLWLCGPDRPLSTNSAALLGVAMAAGALAGRDKLTLLAPPRLEAIGLWIDQLVAESTGKEGRGVIPVAGEALASSTQYGSDRLLVHLSPDGPPDEPTRTGLRDLAAAGTPFAQAELPEPAAITAEFVRWELATAVAGVLLGVNPFDEPNVQQAKDATQRLLEAHRTSGSLPRSGSACAVGGQDAWLSSRAVSGLGAPDASRLLSLLAPGDYFAILAYLPPAADLLAPLEWLREQVRTRTRCATTFGYGPRYLHSTGQLHKGGPATGVFLVLGAEPAADLPVPGEAFTFGVLEQAQASGDFASLDAASRRALHVHLTRPDAALLKAVCAALASGLGRG
jgi:glucose-6-phosphate isomerase/transaldolase/glucose-6-phosphate isomerase